MFNKKMKQIQAIILAGILVVSMTACGSGSSGTDSSEEVPQSGSAKIKEETENVKDGVILPDNFEKMTYPLTALAMEVYYEGNPYYVQFADDSSRDSFWYSAALTSYYLHKNEGWDSTIDEDQFEMIVSALYASYQKGNLEFPDIREGCKYASYGEDGEGYVFSTKDQDYVIDSLDNYTLTITECTENGDNYIVTGELKDTATEEQLGTYQYEVIPSEYGGEGNIFEYSVSNMKDLNAALDQSDSDTSAQSMETDSAEAGSNTHEAEPVENPEEQSEDENETDDPEDETSPEEIPDEYEEEYDDSDQDISDGGSLSQEDAQAQAESYYGSGVSCSFAGMENIDGYSYYKFSAQGEGISMPYILVSTYGDVMAAQKNSDGSWTFDQ